MHDFYSAGFYPYPTREEFWGFWSAMILANRYECGAGQVYRDLLALLDGRDYFVLTTNVDHQFQRAGIDRHRLFYTQGDYGLFQCSEPCCQETFDNEAQVRAMHESVIGIAIDPAPIPRCPHCGRGLTTNLRCDDRFVEDVVGRRLAALQQVPPPPRALPHALPRARRRLQHAGRHQVPVLADDQRQPTGHPRMRKLGPGEHAPLHTRP